MTRDSGVLQRFFYDEYPYFVNDKGQPSHPINTILHAMLAWFKAEHDQRDTKHTSIDSFTGGPEIVDPEGEDETARMARLTVKQRAANLNSHAALLDLLDSELAMQAQWPKHDKVGDLLPEVKLFKPCTVWDLYSAVMEDMRFARYTGHLDVQRPPNPRTQEKNAPEEDEVGEEDGELPQLPPMRFAYHAATQEALDLRNSTRRSFGMARNSRIG